MARVWLCDMARSQKGPEKLWLAAKPAEEIKQLERVHKSRYLHILENTIKYNSHVWQNNLICIGDSTFKNLKHWTRPKKLWNTDTAEGKKVKAPYDIKGDIINTEEIMLFYK